jgi:hypothetical protein
MKHLLIIFLLPASLQLSGQVLNRVYMNVDRGFRKHPDMGLVVHVFDHFSAAAYYGRTKVSVGPVIETGGWLNYRLKNKYETSYLLFGATTCNKGLINLSAMLGPTWVDASEYKDITYVFNQFYGQKELKYNRVQTRKMGCAIRTDMIVELAAAVGLNIGVQYNLNPLRNEFTVHMGLNLGLVHDLSEASWNR